MYTLRIVVSITDASMAIKIVLLRMVHIDKPIHASIVHQHSITKEITPPGSGILTQLSNLMRMVVMKEPVAGFEVTQWDCEDGRFDFVDSDVSFFMIIPRIPKYHPGE